MKKYENKVVTLSNYATDDLQKILNIYGRTGHKLVNTLLAPNKQGIDVMYLFFVKEYE